MSTGDTGWSEYWQQDGADGEVFVSARGERHPALGAHWRELFGRTPQGSKVLDIASGAGSIYATLPRDHGFALYATDIAPEALESLAGRIAGVTTVVASADELPFDDRAFDLVVSQFGIEYAGPDAFLEAGRVVADGGKLIVLAHVEDGYIDSDNKAQLAEATLTQQSGFIPQAIELTRTAFGNKKLLARQEKKFVPLIHELAAAVKRCPRGVHSYLLGGFRQLYENRRQYDAADIVGWLEGMRGEVDKAIDRLSRMRAAALSEDRMIAVCQRLEDAGFINVSTELFMTPNNDKPVAWNLKAERPD